MIPADHILLPDGDITSTVFLVSDGNGWDETEQKEADALLEKGAAVVGIDFPEYIKSLEKDDDDCVYMISDIEQLAQESSVRRVFPIIAFRSLPERAMAAHLS